MFFQPSTSLFSSIGVHRIRFLRASTPALCSILAPHAVGGRAQHIVVALLRHLAACLLAVQQPPKLLPTFGTLRPHYGHNANRQILSTLPPCTAGEPQFVLLTCCCIAGNSHKRLQTVSGSLVCVLQFHLRVWLKRSLAGKPDLYGVSSKPANVDTHHYPVMPIATPSSYIF